MFSSTRDGFPPQRSHSLQAVVNQMKPAPANSRDSQAVPMQAADRLNVLTSDKLVVQVIALRGLEADLVGEDYVVFCKVSLRDVLYKTPAVKPVLVQSSADPPGPASCSAFFSEGDSDSASTFTDWGIRSRHTLGPDELLVIRVKACRKQSSRLVPVKDVNLGAVSIAVHQAADGSSSQLSCWYSLNKYRKMRSCSGEVLLSVFWAQEETAVASHVQAPAVPLGMDSRSAADGGGGGGAATAAAAAASAARGQRELRLIRSQHSHRVITAPSVMPVPKRLFGLGHSTQEKLVKRGVRPDGLTPLSDEVQVVSLTEAIREMGAVIRENQRDALGVAVGHTGGADAASRFAEVPVAPAANRQGASPLRWAAPSRATPSPAKRSKAGPIFTTVGGNPVGGSHSEAGKSPSPGLWQRVFGRRQAKLERIAHTEISTRLRPALVIHVIEARGLLAQDLTGLSDPYCIVQLKSQKYRTSTQIQTLDPLWDEAFLFGGDGNTDDFVSLDDSLTLTVRDWDRFSSDDDLGMVQFRLDEVLPLREWLSMRRRALAGSPRAYPLASSRSISRVSSSQDWDDELAEGLVEPGTNAGSSQVAARLHASAESPRNSDASIDHDFNPFEPVHKSYWFPLQPTASMDAVRGQIRFEVTYYPSKSNEDPAAVPSAKIDDGSHVESDPALRVVRQRDARPLYKTVLPRPILRISIVQARNLKSMDFTGLSDPYVVLRVRNCEQKTKVVQANLNPYFGETFTFGDGLDVVLESDCIYIDVFDKDVGPKNDDQIGSLVLPIWSVLRSHHAAWYTIRPPGKGSSGYESATLEPEFNELLGEVKIQVLYYSLPSGVRDASDPAHSQSATAGTRATQRGSKQEEKMQRAAQASARFAAAVEASSLQHKVSAVLGPSRESSDDDRLLAASDQRVLDVLSRALGRARTGVGGGGVRRRRRGSAHGQKSGNSSIMLGDPTARAVGADDGSSGDDDDDDAVGFEDEDEDEDEEDDEEGRRGMDAVSIATGASSAALGGLVEPGDDDDGFMERFRTAFAPVSMGVSSTSLHSDGRSLSNKSLSMSRGWAVRDGSSSMYSIEAAVARTGSNTQQHSFAVLDDDGSSDEGDEDDMADAGPFGAPGLVRGASSPVAAGTPQGVGDAFDSLATDSLRGASSPAQTPVGNEGILDGVQRYRKPAHAVLDRRASFALYKGRVWYFTLRVTVLKGRNLQLGPQFANAGGRLFCELRCGATRRRTRDVAYSHEPQWPAHHEFVFTETDVPGALGLRRWDTFALTLHHSSDPSRVVGVMVMDLAWLMDKMGYIDTDGSELRQSMHLFAPPKAKHMVQQDSRGMAVLERPRSLGRLRVKFVLVPRGQTRLTRVPKLIVRLGEAVGLRDAVLDGGARRGREGGQPASRGTYCIVRCGADVRQSMMAVRLATSAASFNESFLFDLMDPLEFPETATTEVTVTVYEEKSHAEVGSFCVPLAALAASKYRRVRFRRAPLVPSALTKRARSGAGAGPVSSVPEHQASGTGAVGAGSALASDSAHLLGEDNLDGSDLNNEAADDDDDIDNGGEEDDSISDRDTLADDESVASRASAGAGGSGSGLVHFADDGPSGKAEQPARPRRRKRDVILERLRRQRKEAGSENLDLVLELGKDPAGMALSLQLVEAEMPMEPVLGVLELRLHKVKIISNTFRHDLRCVVRFGDRVVSTKTRPRDVVAVFDESEGLFCFPVTSMFTVLEIEVWDMASTASVAIGAGKRVGVPIRITLFDLAELHAQELFRPARRRRAARALVKLPLAANASTRRVKGSVSLSVSYNESTSALIATHANPFARPAKDFTPFNLIHEVQRTAEILSWIPAFFAHVGRLLNWYEPRYSTAAMCLLVFFCVLDFWTSRILAVVPISILVHLLNRYAQRQDGRFISHFLKQTSVADSEIKARLKIAPLRVRKAYAGVLVPKVFARVSVLSRYGAVEKSSELVGWSAPAKGERSDIVFGGGGQGPRKGHRAGAATTLIHWHAGVLAGRVPGFLRLVDKDSNSRGAARLVVRVIGVRCTASATRSTLSATSSAPQNASETSATTGRHAQLVPATASSKRSEASAKGPQAVYCEVSLRESVSAHGDAGFLANVFGAATAYMPTTRSGDSSGGVAREGASDGQSKGSPGKGTSVTSPGGLRAFGKGLAFGGLMHARAPGAVRTVPVLLGDKAPSEALWNREVFFGKDSPVRTSDEVVLTVCESGSDDVLGSAIIRLHESSREKPIRGKFVLLAPESGGLGLADVLQRPGLLAGSTSLPASEDLPNAPHAKAWGEIEVEVTWLRKPSDDDMMDADGNEGDEREDDAEDGLDDGAVHSSATTRTESEMAHANYLSWKKCPAVVAVDLFADNRGRFFLGRGVLPLRMLLTDEAKLEQPTRQMWVRLGLRCDGGASDVALQEARALGVLRELMNDKEMPDDMSFEISSEVAELCDAVVGVKAAGAAPHPSAAAAGSPTGGAGSLRALLVLRSVRARLSVVGSASVRKRCDQLCAGAGLTFLLTPASGSPAEPEVDMQSGDSHDDALGGDAEHIGSARGLSTAFSSTGHFGELLIQAQFTIPDAQAEQRLRRARTAKQAAASSIPERYRSMMAFAESYYLMLNNFNNSLERLKNLFNWSHPNRTQIAFKLVFLQMVLFLVVPSRWLVLCVGLFLFSERFRELGTMMIKARHLLAISPTDDDIVQVLTHGVLQGSAATSGPGGAGGDNEGSLHAGGESSADDDSGAVHGLDSSRRGERSKELRNSWYEAMRRGVTRIMLRLPHVLKHIGPSDCAVTGHLHVLEVQMHRRVWRRLYCGSFRGYLLCWLHQEESDLPPIAYYEVSRAVPVLDVACGEALEARTHGYVHLRGLFAMYYPSHAPLWRGGAASERHLLAVAPSNAKRDAWVAGVGS